jgi:thioredoxin reductase (NADPH)
MKYDLIIIGAGPAGLSAALDAEYLKLKTLVLEADRAGGALVQTYPWKTVCSFLGFSGMKGKEVADRIVGHVKSSGIEIHENEEVEEVRVGRPFKIVTKKGSYESLAIIIATGMMGVPKKLGIPGEDLDGVIYSLANPENFKGKRVVAIGGGDAATDSALGLESAGAKVWLAHRRDELRAMDESRDELLKSGVRVLWNTEIESIAGKKKVERVILFNNKNNKKTEIDCDHVLISIGSVHARGWLEKAGVKMRDMLIEVDENGMTGVPGIFAAGDIVSKLKRIPQALATGERAAYSAYKYLKNPYWK